jgi:mono/diheme cytochrome c family protein
MFKDTVFAVVLLGILLFLTFTLGVHLEGIAEPASTDYIPRPEWYFLPIFQMLKLSFFQGKNEWLGAVLVPNVCILILLLLPFLDRNPSRLLRNRVKAIAAAFVVLLVAGVLGGIAYVETPQQPEQVLLTQEAYTGKRLFQELKCEGCHAFGKENPKLGPNFVVGKNERSKQWLITFLKDPRSVYPATPMIPTKASVDELGALADFVSFHRMKWNKPQPSKVGNGHRAVPAPTASAPADGKAVFDKKCLTCHQVNGTGGIIGPAFVDGKNERERDWLKRYVQSPSTVLPGAKMPPAGLTDEELEAVTDFVMKVKKVKVE